MPFRTIAGHRRILDLLSRSIAGGSLPPSLIFSGPDGVGKRRVAVAVAQALNCTTAGPAKSGRHPDSGHLDSGGVRLQADLEYDACGKCAACARIARG